LACVAIATTGLTTKASLFVSHDAMAVRPSMQIPAMRATTIT
jgi:hypothetical protein